MYITTQHSGYINQEKNWKGEKENAWPSHTAGDFQTGRQRDEEIKHNKELAWNSGLQ